MILSSYDNRQQWTPPQRQSAPAFDATVGDHRNLQHPGNLGNGILA